MNSNPKTASKQRICVLTGAGISAESGIKTFRDADGLWEGHDVMEVASPQGWQKDQDLVLDFYNQRRRQLKEVKPNAAHLALAELQKEYEVIVITQNVDDLHERAGSHHIIHLHGELTKVRSTKNESYVTEWPDDLHTGDLCPSGHQLRPHIVWFGEAVPMLDAAIQELYTADVVMIIGTSLQVYPAAMLSSYAPPYAPVLYIDPRPSVNEAVSRAKHLKIFEGTATQKIEEAIQYIREYNQRNRSN